MQTHEATEPKALDGGCRCGAVRYRVTGVPVHCSLCHCEDCRRSAGAPVVAWAGVRASDFLVTFGAPKRWSANGTAVRSFCEACGTGLYYQNEAILPGLVDVQIATLDDPSRLPPQLQVQLAERLAWMRDLDDLPGFARYPA